MLYRLPRRLSASKLNGKANSRMVVDMTRFGRFINTYFERGEQAARHYPIREGHLLTQNVKLLGVVHIGEPTYVGTRQRIRL